MVQAANQHRRAGYDVQVDGGDEADEHRGNEGGADAPAVHVHADDDRVGAQSDEFRMGKVNLIIWPRTPHVRVRRKWLTYSHCVGR